MDIMAVALRWSLNESQLTGIMGSVTGGGNMIAGGIMNLM